ncbi:bifunctional riboflavin kinase/FAD synthetase [Corynebacterium sp. A21]|uniref:bifunctional riboflavin kinase/FAD synthetase n=1 Tax=Corynebacterium sp. A21 TaxID=3457318 RepID=UPI003FD26B72
MDIWRGLEEVPQDLAASVVTIGVFDGIHRGHRRLIRTATSRADEYGLPSVLATFDPHPLAVISPERMPPMIGSVANRADLAEELGVDHMLAFRFTAEMAALSPEDFFVHVLLEHLKVKAVIVGQNFTFGHLAAGNSQTLLDLGEKYGVQVDIVDLLTEEGIILSSTEIRKALQAGDLAKATWILGRDYTIKETVVRGAGRGGKELGFPTANMYFPDQVALPADGVYAGWFTVAGDEPMDGNMVPGVRYPTSISVGTNPTFGDERRSVESFILDRSADLYDRRAVVTFVKRLRGMEKFSSVEQLLTAINQDVVDTRAALEIEN